MTDKQKEIREGWGIPPEAKVVMFCGKLVAKKRPMDVVLAARAHFDRSNSDNLQNKMQSWQPWHLLFVGSGELGDELRAACDVRFDADCQNLKVSKSQNAGAPPASFIGFLNQSQISKAYAVGDVLVLPSEAWETWGLVVNEATAAGLPTVVSDQCGCVDDFALKNPATVSFAMGNIPDLVRAIADALAIVLRPHEIAKYADAFSPRITAEAVACALS